MVPFTRGYELSEIELRKNVQASCRQRARLSSSAEVTKQRCALDKLGELERLAFRLVVELFDEVELPPTAANLPCSKGKCEDGDQANYDYGW
jgi:hypothetical protein